MRKILCLAMIGFPVLLAAQTDNRPSTLVSAGPTYVFGTASEWSGTGYNAQVGREFGHFGPAVFRADALYMQRSGNGATLSSMTQRTYAVDGSVLVRRSFGRLAPYGLVGVGLYGDNDWAVYTPGLNAGVGIEASVARVRFFTESRIHQYLRDARYTPLAGRGVTLAPISFGIRF